MKHACQKFVFIFIVSLFFAFESFGQQEQLISGDFSGMSFERFVHQIESTTKYHFYFDTTETNNLTFNLIVNQKTLQIILQEVFLQTDFRYSIDSDMHVFITKKIGIQTK